MERPWRLVTFEGLVSASILVVVVVCIELATDVPSSRPPPTEVASGGAGSGG